MLGHMVYNYLSTKDDCELTTTDLRWPDNDFKKKMLDFDGDYVVNCIGAIHQRKNQFDVNIDLPIWLDKNLEGCNVVHPGTDAEIDDDDYGKSKRKSTEYLVDKVTITKIIKTSIIGYELNTNASLLQWFLTTDIEEMGGWSEHYWNGITTLQWSKICYEMMLDWDWFKVVNVPGTECISKYELVNIFKKIYNKKIKITKDNSISANKCQDVEISTPSIEKQLKEMKKYYEGN